MQEYHMRLALLWERYMDQGRLSSKEHMEMKQCLTEHLKWAKELMMAEAFMDAALITRDPKLEQESAEKVFTLIHGCSKGGSRV